MKTRTFRIAIMTALSAMLIFPTAASAHGDGPCEHMVHDHVEGDILRANGLDDAADVVHTAEGIVCPPVDSVLG